MCTEPISREQAGEMGYIQLAIDRANGIYCGQRFVENYKDYIGHWHYVDVLILLDGPDAELYFEVWADMFDNNYIIDDDGIKWYLMWDNGDVFLYRADIDIDWEL